MPFASKIANHMLFTPLDNKCSVDKNIHDTLTRNEFLRFCYSFPVFSDTYINELKKRTILYDDDENDIFYFSIDKMAKYNIKQTETYENFKNWINTFNEISTSKIYTISGNAGTGKTTFLHKLQENYKEKADSNIEIIILDVSEKNDSINWFGDDETKINNASKASGKIYGSILKRIHNMIFNVSSDDKDSISKIFNNLKNIMASYDQMYKNRGIKGEGFFNDLLSKLDKTKSDLSNIKTASKFFADYFLKNNDPEDDFTRALDILLMMLRCQCKDREKHFIIIFDNLERFINNHEVYNRDLNKIRDVVRNYQNEINMPSNHNYRFKFAMAMRCSSARIYGAKIQDNDTLANDLDVTQWYDISDILMKKENWYINHNINIPNCSLYKQIISDERITKNKKITGLKRFVEPLFNYNKRLVMDFVGSLEESTDYADILSLYEKYWNNGKSSSISKYAARSLIREAIIRNLASCDNMFDYFLLSTRADIKKENDYSRQILTLLYNKYNTEDDESMSLTDILNCMGINRLYMTEKEYLTALDNIATILFHMNSYNRRNNDWIQFIDMQLHNSKDESVFINSRDELLTKMKDDNTLCNFKLVIMDAGISYLHSIYASYEFFSAMYCNKEGCLFSLIPSVDAINNENLEDLPLYRSVIKIYDSACSLIKALSSADAKTITMYHDKNDRTGIDCRTHIINSHAKHLSLLRAFLIEKYDKNTKINSEKFKELTDKIYDIEKSYQNMNIGD